MPPKLKSYEQTDRKPLLLNDKALVDVDCFTYIGSIMSRDKDGNCSTDIKNRLGKA